MLIQFSVENYRSIRDKQTLSLAASKYFKELDVNGFAVGVSEQVPRLLRSSVLYGPNASGKSTLINAVDFMREQVIHSAKESQANEEIDVVPFKLSASSRAQDSEFEVAFVEAGVRYQYGFRCNRTRFTEEWLFAYPHGRTQKWFHRVFDAKTKKDKYRFSTHFAGGKKRLDWADQTRPNALFLSTALQLNCEQLIPVLDWFQRRLRVIKAHQFQELGVTMRKCRDTDDKQRVLDFMNSAGLSMTDIRIVTQAFSAEMLPNSLSASLRDELTQKMAGKELMHAKFLHQELDTTKPVELDRDEESDGTIALFGFAGHWLDAIDEQRVLIVDELDSSLHPLIVHHLVKLLHQDNRQAQLVFTTHDTTLLSQKILRRDQVWFMEKDMNNATQLYPLSDYSPRDNEALERGYLNGRYGGIPFLKDLDFYGQ